MPLVPSRLDFYNIGRNYVIARAKKIDPTTIDVEGSEANIVIAAASFMAQKVGQQLTDGLRDLTLDADGEQLDRVVIDRYQLPRKGAVGAVGPLRFYRASDAGGSGTLDTGTKLDAIGGAQYVTLAPATFASDQTDGVIVPCRAVQAGFAFQVGANTITRLDNPGIAFDPTIQCNNDVAMAGGADREQDPQYRNRARMFWLSARRGTLSAITTGALSVDGVDSASATEAITGPNGSPARAVLLTIADLAGGSNSVLAARVQQGLLEYRAGGITVIISSSVPQLIQVQLSLTFLGNVDTSLLASQVQAAVVEFINSLGANQTLYRSDLESVLSRFRDAGLVPTQGSIALPLGDLQPDVGKTLRVRTQDVTLV